MPTGVYKRKDRPTEGAAVGGGQTEVREPIKAMLAGGSEEDFKDSLPEQTSSEDAGGSPEEQAPRRKRRSKAEIAAAKGEGAQAPVDKRLERAKVKASGLGGAALVESGFKITGKPLDTQEKEDVDDQFYLIASKAGIDPSGSWLFVILYTVALLARLILSRTDLGEQLKNFLEGRKEEKEGKDAVSKSDRQNQG
jgi:hypothetical protein